MNHIRPVSRSLRVGAVSLAVWMFAASAAAAARASDAGPSILDPAARMSRMKSIAPGVTYQAILDDVSRLHAYVLRFDPYGGSSLVAVPAGPTLPAASSTVSMLRSVHAVAGINGDFMDYWRESPAGAFATRGNLLQTRTSGKTDELLGITSIGTPPRLGSTKMQVVLDDASSSAHWAVDTWNAGARGQLTIGKDQIAGYTPYGGREAVPPGGACSARLIDPSGPRWADVARSGITRSYTVGKVACARKAMVLDGAVVLSAPKSGSRAPDIKALVTGTTVSMTWSLQGWNGVTGAIAGNQLILDNGQNTVDPSCSTYLCNRNARTGVGLDANGTVIMVVVDQRGGSIGIPLYDFAELLRDLGAVSALNLDGNGSSTMYVNGKTVNIPSDPGRRVSSALAILPGPDPDLHIDPPI
jgi:hypothetical protein